MADQKKDQRDKAAREETMKKIGIGVGLVAIVAAIIGLVVALQPEQEGFDAVLNEQKSEDPVKRPENTQQDQDDDQSDDESTENQVTLYEYSDFQCPACQAAHPIVKSILEDYGDQVAFVYNDYPLPQHEYARQAAISAQCAFEQDMFFEYHDILFERQRSWAQSADDEEAELAFRSYAEELGLNAEEFDSCVVDDAIDERVQEDIDEGQRLGVRGTPTFFVNGERVETREGYEVGIREALDEALGKDESSDDAADEEVNENESE